MITSASPSATARSRVQLRSSRRNGGIAAGSEGCGGPDWALSSILLSIYTTALRRLPSCPEVAPKLAVYTVVRRQGGPIRYLSAAGNCTFGTAREASEAAKYASFRRKPDMLAMILLGKRAI